MPRGRAIDDDLKAAIIAALLAGGGVAETAKRFKIAHPTVSRLRASLGTQRLNEVEQGKRDRIGDMLVEFLGVNLKALTQFAQETSQPDYIQKHNPADLAEIYSEIRDTAFRLIEEGSPLDTEPDA